MRLIDADKLPEHKFTYKSAKGSDFMRGWNHAIDTIIDNAPTVERPQGRWIPVEPDCRGYTEEFECSNCNNRVKYSYCMKKSEYPICPNCGADMRGGTE